MSDDGSSLYLDSMPYGDDEGGGLGLMDLVTVAGMPFASLYLNGRAAAVAPLPWLKGNASTHCFDIPNGVGIESAAASLHLCTTIVVPCPIEGALDVTVRLYGPAGERSVLAVGAVTMTALTKTCYDFIPYLPVRGEVVLELATAETPQRVPPEEARFVASIAGVLESAALHPSRGSLSTAVLHNHAKAQPYYEAVVTKTYSGNFLAFLNAHPDTFTPSQLTAAKVEEAGLAPLVQPTESRVALASCDWMRLDQEAAQRLRAQREDLRRHLVAFFEARGGAVSQKEVLASLSEHGGFLSLLQPSFGTLGRFLAAHNFPITDVPALRGIVSSAGSRRGSVTN
eukprot:TRINITY_DN3413_c0_g1_i1.p1 TRINITY_DN3413_c0_g1~~TRINITY_DN3413_c0_g1_i1.p1  ORF type:complete len:341 (+),score=104.16 TRINITY_DN3413_c0_g1_i1:46-1068(+)